MALDVEGVVDGGVNGKEALGRSRSLEADPRSFPSACGLVRILGSIVEAATGHMSIGHADLSERSSIGPELVSHDRRGCKALLPEEAAHQLQSSAFVAPVLHKDFQHLALGVDRPPEIVRLASNFHEDLVQVPAPLLYPAHSLRPPLTDLICEVRPEAIYPKTDAFVTNIYAPLVQKVLYVSQRKRKSDIHQHAKLDDLGRCFEVAERVLAHLPRLAGLPCQLKTRFR